MPVGSKVLKYSNIIFIILIIYSLSVFCFAAFKILGPIQARSNNFYLLIMIICIIQSVIFFYCILYLSENLKINISITLFTIFVSIYSFEIYLKLNDREMSQLETKKLIIEIAEKKNIPYDLRTRTEVLEDLKKKGEMVYPNFSPNFLIKHDGLKTNNQKIFPLGGVSNSKIILTNELGYFPIINTDRYGFKNPDYVYDNKDIEVALIGDSYAEGASVLQDQTIAGVLRKLDHQVINFGMSGNGPLIELATLKEYVSQIKPKVVIWLFCTNDFFNLKHEMSSTILMNYLENDNYLQNLIYKQDKIDPLIKNFINIEENKVINADKKNFNLNIFSNFLSIMKLYNFRNIINLNPYYEDETLDLTKDVFKKIIKKAKKTTLEWGGEMYFVYLPRSISQNQKRRMKKTRDYVLNLTDELQIPLIDLEKELFNTHTDPLSLIPFRTRGHLSKQGYYLVSEIISQKIKKLKRD